jgi:hypothetical protein
MKRRAAARKRQDPIVLPDIIIQKPKPPGWATATMFWPVREHAFSGFWRVSYTVKDQA